jgi:hypothetical protein
MIVNTVEMTKVKAAVDACRQLAADYATHRPNHRLLDAIDRMQQELTTGATRWTPKEMADRRDAHAKAKADRIQQTRRLRAHMNARARASAPPSKKALLPSKKPASPSTKRRAGAPILSRPPKGKVRVAKATPPRRSR